jgi:uncharacterized protein
VICFVDTSALFAVLDRSDLNHNAARQIWEQLLANNDTLISTNYILLETSALIQTRLGLDALRTFYQDVVQILMIHWVDEATHSAAVGAVFTGARKSVSLVDCVSFEIMRRRSINKVFTFDKHFAEQKFQVVN